MKNENFWQYSTIHQVDAQPRQQVRWKLRACCKRLFLWTLIKEPFISDICRRYKISHRSFKDTVALTDGDFFQSDYDSDGNLYLKIEVGHNNIQQRELYCFLFLVEI